MTCGAAAAVRGHARLTAARIGHAAVARATVTGGYGPSITAITAIRAGIAQRRCDARVCVPGGALARMSCGCASCAAVARELDV